MANIVNTPIIMYVQESNLTLDGSSAKELMEQNDYPIKIYTNENLDGCNLVKKLQNKQNLETVGELVRDVKKLLRSNYDDREEERNAEGTIITQKAWWVFLENLNETIEVLEKIDTPTGGEEVIEIIKDNDNYYEDNSGSLGEKITLSLDKIYLMDGQHYIFKTPSLYGGTIKSYNYEKEATFLNDVSRRDEIFIKEEGKLEIYFNDDTFTSFTVYNNETDITLSSTPGKENFKFEESLQNIPKPLKRQLELEIPKSVTLKELDFGNLSNNFDLGITVKKKETVGGEEKEVEVFEPKTIILKEPILNFISYSENEGFYYYQENFKQELVAKEKVTNDEIVNIENENSEEEEKIKYDEIEVEINIESTYKIFEDFFSDFSVDNKLTLTFNYMKVDEQTKEKSKIESKVETYEISFLKNELGEITYSSPVFLEEDFNLEDYLLEETADDYVNIYSLKDEFKAEKYNSSGLNEISLGIQGTNYITNSVKLEITPSIASDSWFVPFVKPERAYIGIPNEQLENKNKVAYLNFLDKQGNSLIGEVNSLYFDWTAIEKLYNIAITPKTVADGELENNTEKETAVLPLDFPVYRWNPNDSCFELYENFIVPYGELEKE